jgi:aarF domain-containing kinase
MESFSSFLSADQDRPRYRVPWVSPSSTKEVLIMERLRGTPVGSEQIRRMDQATRNEVWLDVIVCDCLTHLQIGSRVVELCLRELFSWKTMQTDPNWSNFLWDSNHKQLQLLDFGATRRYSDEFMERWRRLLQSAIELDREGCRESSLQLGYLLGGESEVSGDDNGCSTSLIFDRKCWMRI